MDYSLGVARGSSLYVQRGLMPASAVLSSALASLREPYLACLGVLNGVSDDAFNISQTPSAVGTPQFDEVRHVAHSSLGTVSASTTGDRP